MRRIAVLTMAATIAISCKSSETTGPIGPVELVSVSFCELRPNWMAVQNNGDVWRRVAIPANGPVTFDATENVSIAMTFTILGSITVIANVTRDEIGGQLFDIFGCESLAVGNRELTGIVSGLAADETGSVSAGLSSSSVFTNGASWFLSDLANAPLDLVAVRSADFGAEANRVIVRRNLTPQLPPSTPIALDFGALEAAAPEVGAATVSGLGQDDVADVENTFLTATGTVATMDFQSIVGNGSVDFHAVPAPQRIATDIHELHLFSEDAAGGSREIIKWYNAPSPTALALGPAASAPIVGQVAAVPVLRMSAAASSQTAYPSAASVIFSQSDEQTLDFRLVLMLTSAGFVGSTPSAWELIIPDLSGAGYQADWGLTQTMEVEWQWTVFDAGTVGIFSSSPVVGETVFAASAASPVLTKVGHFGRIKPPTLRVFGTPMIHRPR